MKKPANALRRALHRIVGRGTDHPPGALGEPGPSPADDDRAPAPAQGGPVGPGPQPALSEAEIREAEEEHGISFPDEYRAFLLRTSHAYAVNPLRRTAQGWRWDGSPQSDYKLLSHDFPHPDSYADAEDELDDREPHESDFPDPAAHEAARRRWEDECEHFYDHTDAGTVVIRHHGCGFATLLVMTGPYRGTLWFDPRATTDRLILLTVGERPIGFTEWLDTHSMAIVDWGKGVRG